MQTIIYNRQIHITKFWSKICIFPVLFIRSANDDIISKNALVFSNLQIHCTFTFHLHHCNVTHFFDRSHTTRIQNIDWFIYTVGTREIASEFAKKIANLNILYSLNRSANDNTEVRVERWPNNQ